MLQKMKDQVVLPDACKNSLEDKFDPIPICKDIIESKIYGFLDAILDFEGEDAAFIQLIKDRSKEIIVKVIEKTEDGFIEGLNDVIVFIRAVMINMISASVPDHQRGMAAGIVIPTFMQFVQKCWNEKGSVVVTPDQSKSSPPSAGKASEPEESKQAAASSSEEAKQLSEVIMSEF